MTDRLTVLEWLITHETDRDLRAGHIREFNDLWEQWNGKEVRETPKASRTNTGRN